MSVMSDVVTMVAVDLPVVVLNRRLHKPKDPKRRDTIFSTTRATLKPTRPKSTMAPTWSTTLPKETSMTPGEPAVARIVMAEVLPIAMPGLTVMVEAHPIAMVHLIVMAEAMEDHLTATAEALIATTDLVEALADLTAMEALLPLIAMVDPLLIVMEIDRPQTAMETDMTALPQEDPTIPMEEDLPATPTALLRVDLAMTGLALLPQVVQDLKTAATDVMRIATEEAILEEALHLLDANRTKEIAMVDLAATMATTITIMALEEDTVTTGEEVEAMEAATTEAMMAMEVVETMTAMADPAALHPLPHQAAANSQA